jgi:hypothetical protein
VGYGNISVPMDTHWAPGLSSRESGSLYIYMACRPLLGNKLSSKHVSMEMDSWRRLSTECISMLTNSEQRFPRIRRSNEHFPRLPQAI